MTGPRFRFDRHECAGAFGDLGTLLPFVIGLISVCGLDAGALFITLGLFNLLCAVAFRVPVPLQPMKLIAVVAIAAQWSPAMLHACGLATGIIWTVLGLTRAMSAIGRFTPAPVVQGIQAALGILLGFKAVELMREEWLIAFVSIVIIIVFRHSRRVPSALALLLAAVCVMWWNNDGTLRPQLGFSLLPPVHIAFDRIWDVMTAAGFAQLPLTAANAVIATAALAASYWPGSGVTEKKLSLSMGLFNLAAPLSGGIPVCHGAGGLAAQHAFGARTSGTKIIEGAVMLGLGLFLAGSITALLAAFPQGILGVMLLVVAFELIKPAAVLRTRADMVLLAGTIIFSLAINMAAGFLLGIAWHAVRLRLHKLRLEKSS
jgi:MFS superfamily sulfate permease-like transporter